MLLFLFKETKVHILTCKGLYPKPDQLIERHLNDHGNPGKPVNLNNHQNNLDIKPNYFILQISSAGKSQNFHINISRILILIFTLENYGKQMGL